MPKTYVLDTNVLLHDPRALFVFEEHRVVIPLAVIEEIDNQKKKDLNLRIKADVMGIIPENPSQSALCRYFNKTLHPLRSGETATWGISGRNKERKFAFTTTWIFSSGGAAIPRTFSTTS